MNTNFTQLKLDFGEHDDLTVLIQKIIRCSDLNILEACAKTIINFKSIAKEEKYVLSFSGGKDSHVLLACYLLYLKLGYPPLNLTIRFADTELEHPSLYKTIKSAQTFCLANNLIFEIVKGKHSYWYIQFCFGYPVPTNFNRWCTGKLKIEPMQPATQNFKAITGRHYGESKARDKKLKNTCGSDTCGTDLIKDRYDPISHWTNCLIWDAIYYFDNTILYKNCFNQLQSQYEVAQDIKSGSLRLGCFMCPVIAMNTIQSNYQIGLIDEKGFAVRGLLENLRTARRIYSPRKSRKTKNQILGAIYIEDRRFYWEKLNKQYLLERGFLTKKDWLVIDEKLKSDYCYPKTYAKEWIDKQHEKLKYTPVSMTVKIQSHL